MNSSTTETSRAAITSRHLLGFKLNKSADITRREYANGFIKACLDKQVEPEKLIAVVETLDIHL